MTEDIPVPVGLVSPERQSEQSVTPLLGSDGMATRGQDQWDSKPSYSFAEGMEADKDTSTLQNATTFGKDSPASRLKNAFGRLICNITLEPMLFLKMVAEQNFSIVGDTLEIDRVCRINLNYTEEECINMDDGNHTDVQVAVQRYQTLFNYYQNLMDSILPLIAVLILGSLTDKYGRKIPMLMVLAGFIGLALVYVATYLNPSWPVEALFAGTLVVDSMGSWVVFNMAVYSYVTDITTPENRTRRMGFLDVAWYLGGPIGRLLGGWIYRWSGYVAVFSFSAILWTVCFLYVLFLVRESVHTIPESSDAEVKKYAKWGPLKHLIILFRCGLKKRPANGRQILLTLLCLKLMVFLTQAHQMLQWSRRVLQWDATQLSTWSSGDSLLHMLGSVVWLSLSGFLKFHETVIAIGGLFSQGMWCFVLACITGPSTWWLVMVASVLGMFEETIEPSIRSMMTVIVGETDAGKILTLNGLLEAAWLIVDRTISTALYNTFIEVFPQINLVFQGCVCLVLIFVFLVLFCLFKRPHPSSPELTSAQNLVYNVSVDFGNNPGSSGNNVN